MVETGVAHGVTSRIVLEALERVGSARLWSIDLPAMDPTLHDEIGIAVPERLRGRWTNITGTSRRRLPGLLAQIGPIDFFVHDSSHTERNTLFELAAAWPAIGHGAVVVDDVQQSPAFANPSLRCRSPARTLRGRATAARCSASSSRARDPREADRGFPPSKNNDSAESRPGVTTLLR